MVAHIPRDCQQEFAPKRSPGLEGFHLLFLDCTDSRWTVTSYSTVLNHFSRYFFKILVHPHISPRVHEAVHYSLFMVSVYAQASIPRIVFTFEGDQLQSP